MSVSYSFGLLWSIALPAYIVAGVLGEMGKEHGYSIWSRVGFALIAFLVGWVGGGWVYAEFVHDGDARSGVYSATFGGFWIALVASVFGSFSANEAKENNDNDSPGHDSGHQGLSSSTTNKRGATVKEASAPTQKSYGIFAWFFIGMIVMAYGIWWLITPQSFEECVQKNLSNAHTNAAVAAVHRTCRAQHKSS